MAREVCETGYTIAMLAALTFEISYTFLPLAQYPVLSSLSQKLIAALQSIASNMSTQEAFIALLQRGSCQT